MRIDLSADVGEGAVDLPLFPLLTSVSIACGAHAGDAETMDRCVREARRLGVSVGAHPGYPDRDGFGRRAIQMTPDALAETLIDQTNALAAVCRASDVTVGHVKPHGAMYNEAVADASLAAVIAGAVRAMDPKLRLVGPAGSALLAAGSAAGLRGIPEAFVDRRYLWDGTLAPRSRPDALITDPAEAAGRALALARGDPIPTLDGDPIRIEAETLCLHADTPGAPDIARLVRATLDGAGIAVVAIAG